MASFGFQPIQGYSSMSEAALGSQRGIFETCEVIVKIMMNYILLYVSTFALHEVMNR